MRRDCWILSLALVAAVAVAATTGAVAARPDPDPDDDPAAAGELYGDLVVIERDGNGEPVLRAVTYEDPETGQDVTVDCEQPLAGDCALLPLWGEHAAFDPELHDPCEVHEDFVDQLHEVSFGRGSVSRSQPFVLDSAYAEFLKTMNAADAIAIDPARRFQLHVPSEDDPDVWVWKTIDAPLANLGMYREIMIRGCFGPVTDEVTGEGGVVVEVQYQLAPSAIDLLCPGAFVNGACLDTSGTGALVCTYPDQGSGSEWWTTPIVPDPDGVGSEDLQFAATFLAAATDKKDRLHLDEIININTYLGVNEYTFERVKKQTVLEIDYFQYVVEGDWFTYDRDAVFAPDVTANLLRHDCVPLDGPEDWPHAFVSAELALFDPLDPDGVDLDAVAVGVCRSGSLLTGDDGVTPVVCDDPAREAYDPSNGTFGCGGANWFTQAAEHARKTIWFLHNWEPPEIAY